MKILFIQSLTYPFIGVMSLSAVLRREGHNTKLIIIDVKNPESHKLEEIRNFSPGLIAFPVYTGWHTGILNLCNRLKEEFPTPIVLGGPHVTHCPEIITNPAVDYACVGEGEISMLNLANSLSSGSSTKNILGIWQKDDKNKIIDNGASPLPDLTTLPPMDIDLYCDADDGIRNMDNREFNLNRGCPFNCTYCNSPTLRALYGRDMLRTKTPDQAIQEMKYVYDKYPYKSASFTSDNLFLDKTFAREFLDKYKREINVPFYCQMRVEMIDEEITSMLKDAGCHYVTVGIESGSERVRKEILNRHMSNETIINACRLLLDKGIGVNANNMVGIPGETEDEAWMTVKLNAEISPTSSWCSIFQPYPGSALTAKLLENNTISPEIFNQVPPSYFAKSVVASPQELYRILNMQRIFQLAVLFPRLIPIFKTICRLPVPMIFDPIFLWSFYRYVRIAYRKSHWQSLKKVLINAFEAMKARPATHTTITPPKALQYEPELPTNNIDHHQTTSRKSA